jgi:hypothetical protein
MDRRTILSLFGGGAAAAVSGVSAKDAAAKLGLESGLVAGGPLPDVNGVAGVEVTSRLPHFVMARLWRERERAHHSNPHMPAHIATKKSWSPAFKESIHRREVEIIDAFIEKIEADEEFAKRVGAALGLI